MKESIFATVKKFSPSEIGLDGTQVQNTDAALAGFMNQIYMAAGIAAVIVIIVSGYLYVTANGDPGKVVKAKQGIMFAVVGLIVVLLAFAITRMIIGAV